MEQMNPALVSTVVFMVMFGLAFFWGVLKALRCEALETALENDHSQAVGYIHRLSKNIDREELAKMIEKGELDGLNEYMTMYDQEQKKG